MTGETPTRTTTEDAAFRAGCVTLTALLSGLVIGAALGAAITALVLT